MYWGGGGLETCKLKHVYGASSKHVHPPPPQQHCVLPVSNGVSDALFCILVRVTIFELIA